MSIQELLQQLKDKGWTLAALADELQIHYTTILTWNKGRTPHNSAGVVLQLEQLLKRKRIPKRKRYARGRGEVCKNCGTGGKPLAADGR